MSNYQERDKTPADAWKQEKHSKQSSGIYQSPSSTSSDRTGNAQKNDDAGSAPESGDKEP